MSWTEITVLVERAKTGDREAYGELVTRFQSSVYAMALSRVRNPLEAQELAQDVFVHAMRKLPQLRDARCFAGWLRRITARMAINRLTRRGPLFGADPEMLDVVEAKTREENWDRAEHRSKRWISSVSDAIDLGTKDERFLFEPLRAFVYARANHATAIMDVYVNMSELGRVSGWDAIVPEP